MATHGIDEMLYFHGQRFGMFDRDPFAGIIETIVWTGYAPLMKNGQFLSDQIDGDPSQIGSDVQFAYFILGDAAGCQGGHGSPGETEQGGHVVTAGGVGGLHAAGDDLVDGFLDQTHDDIQVVGHEVSDDIHIGDTGTGAAHAADIDGVDAASLGKDGGKCLNRRVEPFDVTDEKDGVVFLGGLDKLSAVIFGGGEGFFDQAVDAMV